jgi:hypothetical protein
VKKPQQVPTTVESITDEQIVAMLNDPKSYQGTAWLATRDAHIALGRRRARPGWSRAKARARCAEAWNARRAVGATP